METLKPKISQSKLTKITSPSTKRITGRKGKEIRNRILLRDEYTCQKCGIVSWHLEVDHIAPLHLGGTECDENRQTLCKKCHDEKTKQEMFAIWVRAHKKN